MFHFKKLILGIIFLFFFIIILVSAYSSETTHPLLTQKSAEIYNQFYQNNLSQQEISWLMEGAKKEDVPPRWINHFYDPISGKGWQGEKMGILPKDITLFLAKIGISTEDAVSSLDWAKNQELQTKYSLYEGNQTWQKAIYKYQKGNKKESYIALGHILHLLQDLAVPAHTRQDTHYDVVGDPEPYENWIRNNNDFSQFQNLSLNNIDFNCQNLEDCFVKLAKYSNENFFSEDTIKEPTYKLPLIINKEKRGGYDIYYGEEKYPLFIFRHDENKSTVDSYIIHSAYWHLLSKKAVFCQR
jgi:hypothetical protein